MKRNDILKMKCVGITQDGRIKIKDIEHGIEDYVLCVSNILSNFPKVHRLKIYYGGDRPFFKLNGVRYFFDETVSVGSFC